MRFDVFTTLLDQKQKIENSDFSPKISMSQKITIKSKILNFEFWLKIFWGYAF